MSDKTAKTTKADLLKMLAEAVLNTPGATQLEPADVAPPELVGKKNATPKRVAKPKVSVRRPYKQRRR